MDNPLYVAGRKFISTKVAARLFDYTSDYVGQLARNGKIESTKVGRVRYVSEDDLITYVRESSTPSPTVTVKVAPSSASLIDSSTLPTQVRDTPSSSIVPSSFAPLPSASPLKRESTIPLVALSHVPLLKNSDAREGISSLSLDKLYSGNFVKETQATATHYPALPSPRNLLQSKVVALVVAILVVGIPGVLLYSERDTLTRTFSYVSSDIQEKVSTEGATALVVDSALYAVGTVDDQTFRDSFTNALETVSEDVYESMSENGLAGLFEKSMVFIIKGGEVPADTQLGQAQETGFWRTIQNFFGRLIGVETELARVIIDARPDTLGEVRTLEEVKNLGMNDKAMIVVPDVGEDERSARVEALKNTFSDSVTIIEDEEEGTGIITPHFKNSTGEDYMYVLVPLEEGGE